MADLSPITQSVLSAIQEVSPAPADEIASVALRAMVKELVKDDPSFKTIDKEVIEREPSEGQGSDNFPAISRGKSDGKSREEPEGPEKDAPLTTDLFWRRFAKLHYNTTVDAVIHSLGLVIPPEGRPPSFVSTDKSPEHANFIVHTTETPEVWLLFDGCSSRRSTTAEVLQAAREKYISKGTPTGDALRRWIALWQPS